MELFILLMILLIVIVILYIPSIFIHMKLAIYYQRNSLAAHIRMVTLMEGGKSRIQIVA